MIYVDAINGENNELHTNFNNLLQKINVELVGALDSIVQHKDELNYKDTSQNIVDNEKNIRDINEVLHNIQKSDWNNNEFIEVLSFNVNSEYENIVKDLVNKIEIINSVINDIFKLMEAVQLINESQFKSSKELQDQVQDINNCILFITDNCREYERINQQITHDALFIVEEANKKCKELTRENDMLKRNNLEIANKNTKIENLGRVSTKKLEEVVKSLENIQLEKRQLDSENYKLNTSLTDLNKVLEFTQRELQTERLNTSVLKDELEKFEESFRSPDHYDMDVSIDLNDDGVIVAGVGFNTAKSMSLDLMVLENEEGVSEFNLYKEDSSNDILINESSLPFDSSDINRNIEMRIKDLIMYVAEENVSKVDIPLSKDLKEFIEFKKDIINELRSANIKLKQSYDLLFVQINECNINNNMLINQINHHIEVNEGLNDELNELKSTSRKNVSDAETNTSVYMNDYGFSVEMNTNDFGINTEMNNHKHGKLKHGRKRNYTSDAGYYREDLNVHKFKSTKKMNVNLNLKDFDTYSNPDRISRIKKHKVAELFQLRDDKEYDSMFRDQYIDDLVNTGSKKNPNKYVEFLTDVQSSDEELPVFGGGKSVEQVNESTVTTDTSFTWKQLKEDYGGVIVCIGLFVICALSQYLKECDEPTNVPNNLNESKSSDNVI